MLSDLPRPTLADILGQACDPGALQTLIQGCRDLVLAGYTSADTRPILMRPRGVAILRTLIATEESLRDLGYRAKDIAKLAAGPGGGNIFVVLRNQNYALLHAGFNYRQIVRICMQPSGARTLTIIANNISKICRIGFLQSAIVNRATGPRGLGASGPSRCSSTRFKNHPTQYSLRSALFRCGTWMLIAFLLQLQWALDVSFNTADCVIGPTAYDVEKPRRAGIASSRRG